jgi:hypothetical protein
MPRTTTFTFDELPLQILNGFECGLVAGSAEISYNRDMEWGIESISLDGNKSIRWTLEEYADRFKNGLPCPSYEHKSVALDEGTPLYLMIYDRLENEWRGKVQDAVADQLVEDRAEAAEERAECRYNQRRDDRMERT